MKDELLKKIKNRDALIGIIGLGYVGLPLVREFLHAGFRVLGFDVDEKKVERIMRGENYLKHLNGDFIKKYVTEGKLEATSDFTRFREPEVLIMCVPTPLGKHHEPDLSYVRETVKQIAENLRRGQVIILESTTYPGTTEEEILPCLEKTGLEVGRDFFLGYSPEREDPGNKKFKTGNIPKIVSGITPACLEVVQMLYDQIVKETVPVSHPRVAEATKIFENIYRAVNISLVNELKILFNKMNIDIWEVIEAAKTKPFGFQAFYPGPGIGGHCIPIDPFYLTWKAREYDFHTRFIELSGELNEYMPYYVIERIGKALNSVGKSIKDSRILVVGIAYKPDVSDLRESAALKIISLLQEDGAVVSYYDPYIPKIPPIRKYRLNLQSIELTPENVKSFDIVVIVTDHKNVNYKLILENSSLIVDTRNVYGNGSISGEIVWKA